MCGSELGERKAAMLLRGGNPVHGREKGERKKGESGVGSAQEEHLLEHSLGSWGNWVVQVFCKQ